MTLGDPRGAYGQALRDLGRRNPAIVVLDADVSHSTMTRLFAKEFPERFFNCGIAEQNMVGIAAGLAASGKTVFISTFAVFAACRCYDQLRVDIAQTRLNVKIVATHGGITVGEDGASHHAIEDLALMLSLPGMNVVVPADAEETRQAVETAAATMGPFYLRLCRPKVPPVYGPDYRFAVGKAVTVKEGKDGAILATGLMVAPALEAARTLSQKGINPRVISVPTLQPLDREAVLRAAAETGALVCAEEHLVHGGLGGLVAQATAEECPVRISFVGLHGYSRSGKGEELLVRHGLTAADIAGALERLLSRIRA